MKEGAKLFCPKCGNPVSKNDNFCPSCGNNLKNVKVKIVSENNNKIDTNSDSKDKTIVFRMKMSQFTQITRIIVLYCKPYTFKVYMNLTLSSKKNVTYCYNS